MTAQPHLLPWFYLAAGAYAGSLLFYLLSRTKIALPVLAGGLVCHGVTLGERLYHFGTAVPLNLFTELYFLPWLLAALTLFLGTQTRSPQTGLSLLIPLNALMVLALVLVAKPVTPSPFTATWFAGGFFCSETASHALFITAGWFGFLFLTGRSTEPWFNGPTIWGFILYSIAQVLGAIWSWLGWAVPFHWSDRHLISAAIWCFYCAYLHLQFSRRWSPREKAWLTMSGALLVCII
ncbi:hypothetical protein FDZ71_18230, partial [bacterium]